MLGAQGPVVGGGHEGCVLDIVNIADGDDVKTQDDSDRVNDDVGDYFDCGVTGDVCGRRKFS